MKKKKKRDQWKRPSCIFLCCHFLLVLLSLPYSSTTSFCNWLNFKWEHCISYFVYMFLDLDLESEDWFVFLLQRERERERGGTYFHLYNFNVFLSQRTLIQKEKKRLLPSPIHPQGLSRRECNQLHLASWGRERSGSYYAPLAERLGNKGYLHIFC